MGEIGAAQGKGESCRAGVDDLVEEGAGVQVYEEWEWTLFSEQCDDLPWMNLYK